MDLLHQIHEMDYDTWIMISVTKNAMMAIIKNSFFMALVFVVDVGRRGNVTGKEIFLPHGARCYINR
jgi:hypothetical protein